MISHNIITAPTVKVVLKNGVRNTLSIRDVFYIANAIAFVDYTSPIEEYSVIRRLCVFFMAAFKPKNDNELRKIFKTKKFNMDVFDEYVAACNKNGEVFDLFDKAHPYNQSPFNENIDILQKPVTAILLEYPSGNNIIIQGSYDEILNKKITPPEAFAALCSYGVFSPASTEGPSSPNGAPPYFMLVKYKSLFEVIVGNSVPCPADEFGPSWEQEDPYREETEGTTVQYRKKKKISYRYEKTKTSLLDGMTLQSRRILLIPDEDGMVSSVYLSAGQDFTSYDTWKDIHVPYKYTIVKNKESTEEITLPPTKKISNIKPNRNKRVWQDLGLIMHAEFPIMDEHGRNVNLLPVAFLNFNKLYEEEDQKIIPIITYGVETSNASLLSVVKEKIDIPCEILNDENKSLMFYELTKLIIEAQAELRSKFAPVNQTRFMDEMNYLVFSKFVTELAETWLTCTEHMADIMAEYKKKVCLVAKDAFTEAENRKTFLTRDYLNFLKEKKAVFKNLNKLLLETKGDDSGESRTGKENH